MRLGRTPTEFLESVDSNELTELYAYCVIDSEPREKEPEDDEEALRKVFGNKNG